MKKLLIIPALLGASFILSAPATANDMSLRICEYVKANDKNRLRSYLKQNKMKIRKIYSQLKCNGDSLLVFAAKSQGLEVGEYIIGKLPAKTVKGEVDELAKYSAHLAEEARER